MESSKAYYFSHILLRNKIYYEGKEFSDKLRQGPQVMRPYLLELWNSIDESTFKEGVVIKDKDRVVTVDDFDITFRPYQNFNVYFFIMPDPKCFMAEAKCAALAIDKENRIRYLTMEIWSENEVEQMKKALGDAYTPQYTVGEWAIKDNQFTHLNMGHLPRPTIECFASFLGDNLR